MDPETRELRALEAEVASLQRECRMLQRPGEKMSGARKSFQKISQSDSEEWESLKDLRSQLGHVKSELSFLSKLTGFNIRDYSKMEDIANTEETENDTKKVLQRHRLSGNCSMVTFQLEFEVLQIETKEKKSSIITDLSIIMEPTEYSELSEFASRPILHHHQMGMECLMSTCLSFTRTESPQAKNQEKYPDSVYLSEGTCSHCMEIHSAKLPGFELVIVWKIQIDEEGKVFPKLDLLTKVPEQALGLDKNRVIETAALSFRSLLGVLGIEAALDSLIRLFSADNN
ncbi:centromere protein P isoform X2 [Apodemus sylvaticus]|uniref:centromere protein P isoform X2 n=1 Tax=Apodemus sylvaticus TaxID=10129 RepID=UPI002243AA34|nr:centromere protein P isoform X2 [Apodemus sylvaticus]